MGRLRAGGWQAAVVVLSLWAIAGCGGHTPAGQSPNPAKITLTPGNTVSVQLGSTFSFTATAQNAAGSNVSATFSFQSTDTSVLSLAGNVACAGTWDSTFTVCTPNGIGMVQVTATALGQTSAPTFVFVHPPIDNITVTGILPPNQLIQEPCLPQGQSMTVQATAYSQGVDVTASVGPFTWSANNTSVVKLTPIVTNTIYNFPTNQATATAVNPGVTQIFATASLVSSTSFRQPTLVPNANTPPTVPVFDFFETCPIQNVVLELGAAGSRRTTFAVSRGGGETAFATVTDVLGNSSLPNLNNSVVLSKIPLTWSASQPADVSAGSGCTLSCSIATPSPGSGAVTASCSPPTCNIGFPQIPAAFASDSALASCAAYLHSFFPNISSCAPFIPKPVYASPLPQQSTCGQLTQPPCSAAIYGLVAGTGANVSVLGSSLGCQNQAPADCQVGMYDFTSGKIIATSPAFIPTPPNSMLFDPVGDKAYMGSNYGAQLINPGNFGTSNSPFSAIGTVTGKILAVAPNGNLAIFSDTLHTPNQVYVVNESNSINPVITALNINAASVAAFSPDNLKAFIFGFDNNGNPTIYVYSTVQALQTACFSVAPNCTPLPANTSVSSIAFSTNAAFAFVAESLGGSPALTAYNTCDNFVSTDAGLTPQVIPLTAPPVTFKVLPDGIHVIVLESNGSFDYITLTMTGIPVATPSQAATAICPMFVSHGNPVNVNLNLGNVNPNGYYDFFVSPDGTLLYILTSDLNTILIYDFAARAVTGGIQLASTAGALNPTPIAADITVDGDTIVVAGSDSYVHQVSTANGGADLVQSPFPSLPNYANPFCTVSPVTGPCAFDLVLAKP